MKNSLLKKIYLSEVTIRHYDTLNDLKRKNQKYHQQSCQIVYKNRTQDLNQDKDLKSQIIRVLKIPATKQDKFFIVEIKNIREIGIENYPE